MVCGAVLHTHGAGFQCGALVLHKNPVFKKHSSEPKREPKLFISVPTASSQLLAQSKMNNSECLSKNQNLMIKQGKQSVYDRNVCFCLL